MRLAKVITITGIVQGVGFRPFVYNLAREQGLGGWVRNDTAGVTLWVEGPSPALAVFERTLATGAPVQAVVFEIAARAVEPRGLEEFEIRKSAEQADQFVPISPEVATCADCVRELFDPADRRYRYSFINCTNCGPRFTIVEDIPYDRPLTTMAPFAMCAQCRAEYDDPGNRRFHAQPNACPVCGPRLELLDQSGNPVPCADVVGAVIERLRQGRIVAIKGLGGYHLACDAQNDKAVKTLRARKFREHKPFALMVADVQAARALGDVDPAGEALLSGTVRPIVLLRRRPDAPVSEAVAPGQMDLGVMLPYTPLHHVLLAEAGMILVMTSGNISDEPIAFRDDEALRRLNGLADYFLVHDRRIHIRTDDSVVRVVADKPLVLRRSRGYAPHPLILPFEFKAPILACGAELKNTFCLTRKRFAFLSHHIGDLENLETIEAFEQGIAHFQRIFNTTPACLAHDHHPEYLATKYALARDDIPRIGVQHHHAHIVGCMGENNVTAPVIGVAFDGTGYGDDGHIWGGEFLVCDDRDYRRAAHLQYVPLPGGAKAIKEPWRMAAVYLHKVFGDGMWDLPLAFVRDLDRARWRLIARMIQQQVNTPQTSSAGRLFDAVSALTGICREAFYEGQAAVELEMAAGDDDRVYEFDSRSEAGKTVVLPDAVIEGIVADLIEGESRGVIAARFHNTVAALIASQCDQLRRETGITTVALSGGCFQNMRLTRRVLALLTANGFSVLTHRHVPPNDGGLSLGQAIVANRRLDTSILNS